MLINGWSLALIGCGLAIVVVVAMAIPTAVRVLHHWDPGADTARQMKLEGETWLSAALLQYAAVFQMVSLLLLVLAANSFAGVLAGAMCATGALLANPYGIPGLIVKLILVFGAAFWIVLHRLDLSSAHSPLIRSKYLFLLLLSPLFPLDFVLQWRYLSGLEPDIITSCCGVIFRPTSGDGYNLLGPLSTSGLLAAGGGLTLLIVIASAVLLRRLSLGGQSSGLPGLILTLLWGSFLPLALATITIVISPYVYGMPHHRCPFDLIQGDYALLGYPLYLTLFGGTFWGGSAGLIGLFRHRPGLAERIPPIQARMVTASLVLVGIFLLLAASAPLRYLAGSSGN